MDSNEDDEYLSDPKNLMLLVVGMVWQRLNRDIFKYIDMPVGTLRANWTGYVTKTLGN